MLCAQHALNSLLQGPYFDAADLSVIGRNLDELEINYDDDRREGGMNVDDTGFFSVQVLEKALQVWGLTLVRWRSERMQPYQDHPHTQMAFILNSNQHWYTLRRFGHVSTDPNLEADTGFGHWFNLDSCIPKPERVGKLYLGMVLHQAETEGYSVFAVIQIDPEGRLALPRTEADELAASIPEDERTSPPPSEGLEGFEGEDLELQRALQASLMGASTSRRTPPLPRLGGPSRSFTLPFSSTSHNRRGTRTPTQPHRQQIYPVVNDLDDDDEEEEGEEEYHTPPLALPRTVPEIDPVEASRLRSQALMDHFTRQQQSLLEETFSNEAGRIRARAEEQMAEDAELQRAIAESRAMAEAQGQRIDVDDSDNANNRDDIIDVDADEDFEPVIPPLPLDLDQAPYEMHHVYDDEDEALQAALRASLETVPEGFRIPSTPPRPRPRPPPSGPSGPLAPPPVTSALPPTLPVRPSSVIRTDSVNSEMTDGEYQSEADSSVMEEEVPVSVEEMRRRRLAKFGG